MKSVISSVALLWLALPTTTFAASTWTQCAVEGGYCSVSGTRNVRYGADTRWAIKSVTGGIGCNNTVFGDPAYGVSKACYYETVSVSLPDLVVVADSIKLSPAVPAVGQAVTFSAVLKNNGTVATASGAISAIAFQVDGATVSWGSTSASIAPGASVTITAIGGVNGATWKAVSGTHTITAFADDVNRIVESDENNNKLSKSITVGSTSATPTPTPTPTPSAPASTPTPTPTPVSSSGSNVTISQAVNDMSQPSEALPIAAWTGWMRQPVITQYSASGSSIASWWTAERPAWCYGLLSWYTLYEAEGNKATNTRVEIKNLRVYILSNSTRKWTQWNLVVAPNTGLWSYPFNSAGTPDRKMEADGGVSFRPVYPNFMHGYGNTNYPAKALPNPSDIRAMFTAVDMRLVVADPTRPDDRADARYVVDSGADYYPDGTYKMWSTGYAPGVGNGRYLLVQNNWRSATLVVPNKDQGATMNEILANPPPMN